MVTSDRIPLPADLPVPWEQPEDEACAWTTDPMHFPRPLTQIDDATVRSTYRGLNHGFALYDMPVRGDARCFWTHHYNATFPLDMSDDDLATMAERSERKLEVAMGSLMEQWETRWLPEIKRLLAGWEAFDLPAASLPGLLAHLDVTLRQLQRAFDIHFEVILPSMLPISLFDEFYRELFDNANPFGAFELLQGFDNMTVRGGRELWKLSSIARASADTRAILEDCPAASVIERLVQSEDGRAFLTLLRAYLDEYGQRGESWGVSYTSWIEDPTPAIKNLKDYIAQPERDPDQELANLADEREQLVIAARERLETYPEPVRSQFEFLLKAAQEGTVLTEDHGYWIDFRVSYEVRRVFMELGRRFVTAGVLAHADDIFHLTVDEIRDTAHQMHATSNHVDLSVMVDGRKSAIVHYASVNVPPMVGTMPPGPPPVNPGSITNAKFFGRGIPASADPLVVNGAAGSPGVVRGTARVVHSLSDAGRIGVGDILVAPTTAPPWTPLFATVAAVVTDTGGVLSHCAVVAREYRIPAVVGTGMATTIIKDGQLIEVDGNQGVVRIVRD